MADELMHERSLLVESSSALLLSRTSAEVIHNLIELGPRYIVADAYAVWRKGQETGTWMLRGSSGLSQDFVESIAGNVGGEQQLSGEPMFFEDVEHTPLLAEGFRSMLIVPLRIHGELSGTVVFYWKTRRRLAPTEMLTARSLGALAAAALTATETLERRDMELELVTDNVPALISYLDTQQRFRRVNRAYEVFFGLKREDIVGRTVAEIVGPEHYDRARPNLERAVRGVPVSFRSRVRRHDGVFRDIDLTYTPDRGPDGTVHGVVVMVNDVTDQKRAEELLAHLASIVDSSRDAIVSKTLEGIITSWNLGAERIFGYSAAEAVGRHITLITPPDRLAEEEGVLARLRQGQKVDHFETERLTKDGRLIATSLTVSPLFAADGTIIGASKIARDITEQKRSAEQLLTSERYLHTVLDSIPDCVKVLGADGTVVNMNRSGLTMLDADSPDQVLGRPVYPLIHETHRDAFRAINENVFDGGQGGTLEFALTTLKGSNRILNTAVVPLLDAQNRAVGALSVTRDISKQKDAESERQALLLREKKARETAELLNRVGPILSAELDPRTLAQKVTDLATQAVSADFGALFHNLLDDRGESYELYTLSGVPREVFAGFPMPRNTAVFGPTFLGQGPVRSDDITKDPRYGKNSPYHGMPAGHLPVRSYLAVPVVSRTGKVLGGLFFGHAQTGVFTAEAEDVAVGIAAQAAISLDNAALFADSQRSQAALLVANQELIRTNEDLNQFTHSASHDLQEPLRAIAVYSELLRRRLGSALSESDEQYIGYIVKGARRMESLIRDLLAYNQASAPSDEPCGIIDSDAALDAALSGLKAGIDDSKATIIRGVLPRVKIPPVHLMQVFQNLVGNAIKYRDERPLSVKIMAKLQNKEWVFTVEDNGIGIQEQYQEQIFGIFKRLHTADEYPGTGMGLAICERILHRAGGRIWVRSEAGRGSTFFFTLPIED